MRGPGIDPDSSIPMLGHAFRSETTTTETHAMTILSPKQEASAHKQEQVHSLAQLVIQEGLRLLEETASASALSAECSRLHLHCFRVETRGEVSRDPQNREYFAYQTIAPNVFGAIPRWARWQKIHKS